MQATARSRFECSSNATVAQCLSVSVSRNTMRIAVAALTSVFMCALLNVQGAVHSILEPEVYTIEQSALRHSAAVAFSIGYPKGWTKSENTTVVSDNLGDLASVRDHELVCRFMSPIAPLDPSAPPRTMIIITNYASITIFRAYGATAKEEAEDLAGRLRKIGDEVKRLAPVKTKAGDSGYLLISDDEAPGGHRLKSDFFFRVGSKGHIRISIDSMGTFLGMQESLQNLVLESLRFPQANQPKAANAATALLCSRTDRRGVAGRVGWARLFE